MQYRVISSKPAYCLHVLHIKLHIFLHILLFDFTCILRIFYILFDIFYIFWILISITY
jgi:hypothetical protein